MEGFNPYIKVSAEGDAQLISPEKEQVDTTLEAKLRSLSETERAELLQDALEQYSDLESLIHAINRLEPEPQDTLF